MITLLPIAVWSNKPHKPMDTNGTNWPFFCWANRNHPFAAAIMAQEIYESRFQTVRLLAVAAPLIAVAAWFDWMLIPWAIVPAALLVGLLPRWRREGELRGQAVECEVRETFYGGDKAAAVGDAALQLTGYSQFRGWSRERLILELIERGDIAEKWVDRNASIVARAYKEAQA